MPLLEVLKRTVAVPEFHALGHSPDELPQTTDLSPFDLRAHRDVVELAQAHGKGAFLGCWTHHLIHYARENTLELLHWIERNHPFWTPEQVQAAYWKESRPEYVEEMVVGFNALTDYFILNYMFKTIGVPYGSTPSTANRIILANSSPAVQLNAAVSSGTSLTVAVNPTWSGTNFSNGQTVIVGYGSSHPETLVVSGTPTSTSITLTSAITQSHVVGEWVVLSALPADNPSTLPTGYYDSGPITGTSTSGSNGFAYTGAGLNGRQVVACYNFPSNSSAPASGYTDKYLSLVAGSSFAVNSIAAHQTSSPLLVNANTGVNVAFTDTM